MDSWPLSQCDGPHPQDAQMHSMAGAIDLSRRRRETLGDAGAAETLNRALGSGCVSGVPVGDRRVSPPCLEWPIDRTEVPDGPVRTKGEAAGGACFAQLGHGKSATASQWGGQKAERQNGSVHPRQRDGCAAGSWGRGPCSGGAEGHVPTQGCYAVNGGHLYGAGGAACTAPVSPGGRAAPSIEPRSATGENPVTSVLDAKRTGPAGERSGGSTVLAGPERPRRDRGDEALVTESSGASPRPGASPLDNEGVWGSQLDAAVGCCFRDAGLSTCSVRTVTSETIHNIIPLPGVKAANCRPPEQHGSLDAEGEEMPMSLQSGVCEVGDVQASLEMSAWSGEELGTKAACDDHSGQQPECVGVLPQTCSPPARPTLAATPPESGLQGTSPPSGEERDDPRSLDAARGGQGGGRKCSASSRVVAKKPRSARKRPRSVQLGPSALFGPREPEITLRYASHKGDRRCSTATDAFVPYVRLERGEFSVCSVVNSPEEEQTGRQNGQPQADSQFGSSAVPTSSCLLLGRLATGVGIRPGPLCCLCHRASNVLELGDLHGPYRPIGTGPPRPPPSPSHAPEEEESNQSDSSCGLQGGALKRGFPSETAHGRLGDRDVCLTRPSKWPKEGAPAEERHCEPDPREYWIHEDCGVWSPGVFLVQGKLYGLEEAVRFGRETVCSLCHKDGATLGCFFKTCPSKFHFSCAVQADCVLNKENFSMKCPTHKNRPVKGSAPPEHW
ncbi:retinoic acid-induced protein 1-like [Brienomyrus brachyistius]|uniref:retinoic acid-induced protein 1-like n=1 Tax=Brienomyrus brachyistius TaxID=42636 RepID=UPI0020B38B76|nr:retinoic acid-induced protein 1-like [Brienomyrus brachyistius]XP_048847317.1 retinoic acid-induced protein 1-like [Brienomyrus brachyistius]XP_048847318.1 retinoic acid-induced protein 1-like [Brienomyrus brachyistius]XP_048847319.1 retinoic acid-induced protein 1-like [Brienomyrus brachyistius]